MTVEPVPQLAGMDVSRETLERLQKFEGLLRKWTRTINLVSTSTINAIWDRHILDSAQVVRHAVSMPSSWADLGSGGGLPGIVIACLLAERSPDTRIILVESDIRKATFLRTASRELNLSMEVIASRIEAVPPLDAQIVSARALAPLAALLQYVERHLAPAGTAFLQKGKNADAEVAQARKDWNFDCTSHPSLTDPTASILEIKGLNRA